MPTAPHADQLRLLDVQACDSAYQKLLHAKKTHPTVAAIAQVESQIEDLHGTVLTSRTAVSDISRELAKAELDVEQVVGRLAKDRERLESGSLTPKDTVAVSDEVESLTRRQSALEEVQMEVMERLEAHQEALNKVEAAHQELVESRTLLTEQRDAAFAELKEQAAKVVMERKNASEGLDPALLAMYDGIRKRLGSGAATLRAGRCSGCGMELNPSDRAAAQGAAADAVVTCEECGRILVRDTDALAAGGGEQAGQANQTKQSAQAGAAS